jgi:hypothetical protein
MKSFKDYMSEAKLEDDPEIAKMDAREKIMKDKIRTKTRNDKPDQAQNIRRSLGDLKNKRRDRAVELRNRDRNEPEE